MDGVVVGGGGDGDASWQLLLAAPKQLLKVEAALRAGMRQAGKLTRLGVGKEGQSGCLILPLGLSLLLPQGLLEVTRWMKKLRRGWCWLEPQALLSEELERL